MSRTMPRNIVQIAVSSPPTSGESDIIYALADDGTLWSMQNTRDTTWVLLPALPPRATSLPME